MSEETAGEERHAEDPIASVPTGATKADIGWFQAWAVGAGVFVYFAILTVWLPSRLLRMSAVASSRQWLQDVTVVGSWAAALLAGLVMLRQAQRKGWI